MAVALVPAIIGERFEEIQAKFEQVRGLVEWVQIDIVDGLFASPPSWPYKHKEEIRELRTLTKDPRAPKIELHLMLENPESEIDRWLEVGASRILFHAEATPRVNELIDHCETPRLAINRQSKERLVKPVARVGIVLNLGTPPERLEHLMDPPTFIQCMSIARIGQYGATFSDRVFPKLEYLRRKYPHATLSVDGGVSLENTSELIAAGARQLVVGSALWKSSNVKEEIQRFQKAIQ